LAFESSAGVHVRPQVFVALPSVRVDMVKMEWKILSARGNPVAVAVIIAL
jgi:hypothetical protein